MAPKLSVLSAMLPTAAETMEDQARMTLRVLIHAPGTANLAPLPNVPGTCPNCGGATASPRTPYCSDFCRSVSAFVRQFRNALELGEPTDERLMMFGQALWFIVGGGRPLRVSIAPASAIKQVFKRTEGKCETCGEQATTVDNVGSG